ncbi:MAG: PGPGW domain-containing protein [Pirellulaceae bacterium]|nr:PGPGW domain-containing protein [Pirellulaceae bacterium]
MNDWIQWIQSHQTELGALATVSVLMFVASLVLIPIIVARIPNDYFAQSRRPNSVGSNQPFPMRALLIVAKNMVGLILLGMGIAMLILPGQGLLSIFLGIMLMDFPGKFRLERWLVSRRPILRSINWLRRRSHRAELTLEE